MAGKREGYVFGYDFGTLSCRLVALDLADGALAGSLEYEYPHGVISETIPGTDIALLPDWCLQHSDDWIKALTALSRDMLVKTGIKGKEIKSIGIDFTSCTLVPVMEDASVLCTHEQYRNRPHAWPKLWKHHAAQQYAEEIETLARTHTTWLKDYFGNNVSSEWVFPKILQIVREDYEVYKAADLFMEALDWIPFLLSGNLTRSTAGIGVNAFWVKGLGYPDKRFFEALDARFAGVVAEKMRGREVLIGEATGFLKPHMADRMGLTAETVICSGHSDSAVAGCGAGAVESGDMLLVMGTSTCHQMISRNYRAFDGVCAIVEDGMVPGLYGYESGQPASGDIFSWYVENCMPKDYAEEAERQGVSRLKLMDEKAARLQPGESGLVALDWLNGNRSVLSNYNLSGSVIGLTLTTRPEELYRALVEANLFGSRRIIENYRNNGIEIKRIIAVGSLARKSPFVIQLLADILGDFVVVPQIDNVPAMGSAVCAAAALGSGRGGFNTVQEASAALIPKERMEYSPNMKNHEVYNELYVYYKTLHDFFGMDDALMRGLKNIKNAFI
ncbi:MAG: ribulokinase [Treponema sp.]|jgi:L-ribulokinase|nr:ribulokinase [Treponema sp.]